MTRATKAWARLVALSAASTALAASGLTGAALAVPILVLAGLKAHLILRDYLGLMVAPGWLRRFDLVLALVIVAFGGLALAA